MLNYGRKGPVLPSSGMLKCNAEGYKSGQHPQTNTIKGFDDGLAIFVSSGDVAAHLTMGTIVRNGTFTE